MFRLYDNFRIEDSTELNSIPRKIFFDIHFRNKTHRQVQYPNISEDYNGVSIIGDEFIRYANKKVYDNGWYIGNDYALTDLPPVQMIALFPKRHFERHNITVTYDENQSFFYKKTYKTKFRNLDENDMKFLRHIKTVDGVEKYVLPELDYNELRKYKDVYSAMSNNLMWVDYIDHKCHITINNNIYLNDTHYEILAPNLIMFKTKPFGLNEVEGDYLDITVHFDGLFDDNVMRFQRSSKLFDLYNDEEVVNTIFENFVENFNFETDEIKEYLDGGWYPEKYDDDVFRGHMFLTKYFSTEVNLVDNATQYGINWFMELSAEFPEYVYVIYDIKTKIAKYLSNKLNTTLEADNITPEVIEQNGGIAELFEKLHIDVINAVFANNIADVLAHEDRLYLPNQEDRDEYNNDKQVLMHQIEDIIDIHYTPFKESLINKIKSLSNNNKKAMYNEILNIFEDEHIKEIKAKFLDFNTKWSSNVYELDETDGTILTIKRGYKEPVMPRIVQLPEPNPLNILLTNHAVAVNHFNNQLIKYSAGTGKFYNYDNLISMRRREEENNLRKLAGFMVKDPKYGPDYKYWDVLRIYHSNRENYSKISQNGNSVDVFKDANILPYWIKEDSRLLTTVPLNYCIVPNKTSINYLDDPDYMETWVDIIKDDKIQKDIPLDKQDLNPIRDYNARWIDIYPEINDNNPTLQRFRYTLGNRDDNITLRDLFKANNMEIPDGVKSYGYYKDGELHKINLDDDLRLLDHEPCIGSPHKPLNDKSPKIVPIYDTYKVTIDLGPIKDSDDVSDSIDRVPVLVTIEVPKKKYGSDFTLNEKYPHLVKDVMTTDELNKKLIKEYGFGLDKLERYINREIDDISLYEITRNPLKSNQQEYTKLYTLNDDGLSNKINSDKYLVYYGKANVNLNTLVNSKILRIFDIDKSNASLVAVTPQFSIPTKYNLRPINYRFLVDELTNTYIVPNRDESLSFIDYMAKETNNFNNTRHIDLDNVTPEDMEANATNNNELSAYREIISNANKYNVDILYDNELHNIDLTDVGFNLFTNTTIDKDVEIYFTPDKYMYVRSILDEKINDKVEIPPFVNDADISNIGLSKDIINEHKYAYWLSDSNIDDDIDFAETRVTDRVGNIPLNVNGVTFNALSNVFDIYSKDRSKDVDEYNMIVTVDLTNPENAYKKLRELKVDNSNPLYVDYHGNRVRLMGVESLIWKLYKEYMDKLNVVDKKDMDIKISHDIEGTLNLNELQNHYNRFKKTNLTPEVISKWKQAYGAFIYTPNRVTRGKFIQPSYKYIDLTMWHPGFKLEIAIQDYKGNTAFIRNRAIKEGPDTRFAILGDRNFTNIITSEINYAVLNNYLSTISINSFKPNIASVTIHDGVTRKDIVPMANSTTLLDVLAYAGQTLSNGLRRYSDVPIIRLTYKLSKEVNVEDIIETADRDKWENYQFANNNVLGFKLGMGNTVMLKEYDTYFDISKINR